MWWLYVGLVLAYLVIIRKFVWPKAYLGGIDSTFATADANGLRTTIHCVFTLGTNVTEAAFRELLETKYLVHRRLKQRLIQRSWLWHYWEDVKDKFDINHHFMVVPQLPAPNDQDALEQYVSKQLITALHPDRPLWEFHLIRNYGPNRDQCVVLYRVHHCVGDGIALMRIALTVFESKGIATSPVVLSKAADAAPSPSPKSPVSPLSVSRPAELDGDDEKLPAATANTPPAAAAAAVESKAGDTKSSKPKSAKKINYLSLAWGILASVVKLLVLPPDPVSTLKSSTNMTAGTTQIKTRWSREPIPLPVLKKISAVTKTSINDILVSCGSGAISTFLNAREKNLNAVQKAIQAVLWVSLRGLDLTVRTVDFSNKLGTVYLKLPLHVNDPIERLKVIKKQTEELIASPEAYVSFGIMKLIGFLPPVITRMIWNASAFKVTLSMSNLPGPSQALTFAGGDVTRFIFFVPPVKTIGHFLCILSYNNSVVCGLACDERLVDDPIELVKCFHAEVDKLTQITAAAK